MPIWWFIFLTLHCFALLHRLQDADMVGRTSSLWKKTTLEIFPEWEEDTGCSTAPKVCKGGVSWPTGRAAFPSIETRSNTKLVYCQLPPKHDRDTCCFPWNYETNRLSWDTNICSGNWDLNLRSAAVCTKILKRVCFGIQAGTIDVSSLRVYTDLHMTLVTYIYIYV